MLLIGKKIKAVKNSKTHPDHEPRQFQESVFSAPPRTEGIDEVEYFYFFIHLIRHCEGRKTRIPKGYAPRIPD